jgi:nucleoside 2-deoxyribosyltransferase
MKVYITASFKGSDNKEEIERICSLVKESGFEDFCFIRDVENYKKVFNDAHELMQRAKKEISECDALLIEYDGPGHGRMVELGIAYALDKKIILITKVGTLIKETILGVTDNVIEYKNIEDIVYPLSQLFSDCK